MTETSPLPAPGSDEAIEQGCTCPVLANNYGKGVFLPEEPSEPYYWKSSDCPIHGTGLELAQKDQLAHTQNPDSVVNTDPANPDDTVG